MKRRDLIKHAFLGFGLSLIPFNINFAQNKKKTITPIKPKRLKQGDLIGLAAPASFIDDKELEEAVKNVEKLGFKAKYNDNILDRSGYLAGSDEHRANEINNLFEDKEVKGIFCIRGGYGTPRIAKMLNYSTIKRNPKVICGYSDITSLLYSIYSQTGLVCFHGPVATSTFNDFSVNYFVKTLMEPQDKLELISAENEDFSITDYQRYVINEGIVEGLLVGGNLSLVVNHIGTKYDIDLKGKILFLEEINEEPYRIDRMLTQLINADKFNGIAGIALGVFRKCEVKKVDPSFSISFTLKEVLLDRLKALNVPTVYGLSFGHITNKFTLPFGINAKLNTNNFTLTLTEPAVL